MAHKTIVLKGDPLQKEKVAAGTITPGDLIERTSAGKVQRHSTKGGDAFPIMFAIEDSLQGNEIGDNYSTGDQVQFVCPRPGDEIYAYLAQGENVSIGDPLESDGDGKLRKHTTKTVAASSAQELSETIYSQPVVGIALEALDLSTSADSDTRIKIEIV